MPPPPLPPWAELDQRLALAAKLPDPRPEGITEEELGWIEELKAAVLQAEGLKVPPEDWSRLYYSEQALLRFLRAKGSVAVAREALLTTLRWARTTMLEALRTHEREDHQQHKAMIHQYLPDGPFGVDRRGAPVTYIRLGLKDQAGLIREAGLEVCQRSAINRIHVDTLRFAVSNVETAPDTAWMGILWVVDLQGISWARGQATIGMLIWFSENVVTPHYPELTYLCFILNVPWYFSFGWAILSPFIPARTKTKFRIYSTDYMEELQRYVAPEQIPAFLGGSAKEPWPYGEGGDVPEGAGRLEAGARAEGGRSGPGAKPQVSSETAAAVCRSSTREVAAVIFISYTLHMLMQLSGMLGPFSRLAVLTGSMVSVQLLHLTRCAGPPAPGAAAPGAVSAKPAPKAPPPEQSTGARAAGGEGTPPAFEEAASGAAAAGNGAAGIPYPGQLHADGSGTLHVADSQTEGLLGALFELPGHLGELPAAWPRCVDSWAESHGTCLRLARRSPESGFTSDLPYGVPLRRSRSASAVPSRSPSRRTEPAPSQNGEPPAE